MGKICPLTKRELSFSYCQECDDKICEKIDKIKYLIPDDWYMSLVNETKKDYFISLANFIDNEYKNNTIYPSFDNIFKSIQIVKPKDVKVVILGQDPYHEPKQAQGLSFSVNKDVPLPKSLKNIYTELVNDVGGYTPETGDLTNWAEQGVLLLNTVLTVRQHEANSHKNVGWENVTKQIMKTVLEQSQPKVFILWGTQAKNTFFEIYNNEPNVYWIISAHPSPLSAYRGFFGSKPFSKTNDYLRKHNLKEIQWN